MVDATGRCARAKPAYRNGINTGLHVTSRIVVMKVHNVLHGLNGVQRILDDAHASFGGGSVISMPRRTEAPQGDRERSGIHEERVASEKISAVHRVPVGRRARTVPNYIGGLFDRSTRKAVVPCSSIHPAVRGGVFQTTLD
jgi:hypothetical protein